jgi:hypothetical protein
VEKIVHLKREESAWLITQAVAGGQPALDGSTPSFSPAETPSNAPLVYDPMKAWCKATRAACSVGYVSRSIAKVSAGGLLN